LSVSSFGSSFAFYSSDGVVQHPLLQKHVLVLQTPASANYCRYSPVCKTLETESRLSLTYDRSLQPRSVSVPPSTASLHPAMQPHSTVHPSRPREMLASREREARCVMTCGDPTFRFVSTASRRSQNDLPRVDLVPVSPVRMRVISLRASGSVSCTSSVDSL